MTENKRSGAKPLDYHADIMNMVEPIINLDSPTKQEEYFKKKIIEALEDIPKPKKTGYLVMTPNENKIETIKSFENGEISFKCELKDEFGFGRRLE